MGPSSNKAVAWQVYAAQLTKVDRGRAMWLPEEPTPIGVTIGDVGFIDQESGAFRRLFNITKPAKNPINSDYPPPEDFTILEYNKILESESKDYVQKGPYCSKNVRNFGINPHAGGGSVVATAEASFKYSCSKSQGALLFLSEPADRLAVYQNDVWVKYIKNNYPSWMRSLEATGLRDLKLVVVRGYIKASTWAVAAWCDKSTEHEITLSGSGGVAQGGISFTSSDESSNSVEKRVGPQDRLDVIAVDDASLPRDQCIFLSYYQVATRLLWLAIKAKAGNPKLPPGDGGDDGNDTVHVGNEGIDVDETYDPIDDIIDYLFTNTDADVVIVSDADLYEICDGTDVPINFPEFLRTQAPRYEIVDNVAYFSIIEAIYKTHEHRAPNAPPAQGVPGLPPQDPQGGLPDDGSSKIDDLRAGLITFGSILSESRTMKWPHIVFLESDAEGGAPCPAALSKDGTLVGIGFEDCIVRVWNIETEQLMYQLEGHDDTVLCTAFSPDSKKLVSGSADGTLVMWDMESGRTIRQLEGHVGDVWSAVFSPDGKTLATGSVDTTVRFWNVESGRTTAVGEGHTAVVQNLAFLPGGNRVVSCADMAGRVWDPRTGTELSVMRGHTGVIWGLGVSHNGARIATGSEDHTARIWGTDTGTELVTIRDHTGPVWSVQFSPDDRKLISGSYDSTIMIHDSYSGNLYFTMKVDESVVHSVAYSPIGDLVAGGYADGSIKLWNGVTGEIIAVLRGHSDKIKSLQFSSDHDNIVTSSDDGTVRVWSAVDVLRAY